MEEERVTIENVVEEYKKLSKSEKEIEIGREMAELTNMLRVLLNDVYQSEGNMEDDKFDDIMNCMDEDEYLNNLYTRIMEAKEMLAVFSSAYIALVATKE